MLIVGAEASRENGMDYVNFCSSLTPSIAIQDGFAIGRLHRDADTTEQIEHAIISAINLAAKRAGITQSGGAMSDLASYGAAKSILRDFQHLSLDDILLAIEMGVAGKLGRDYDENSKMFNSFAERHLLSWCRIYEDEVKLPTLERQNHNARFEDLEAPSTIGCTEYEEFKATLKNLEQIVRSRNKAMSDKDRLWDGIYRDAMGCEILETDYYFPNGEVDAQGNPKTILKARFMREPFMPEYTQEYMERNALALPEIPFPSGWYWVLPDGNVLTMKHGNELLPIE
jgi:hypothetical protein